MKFDVAVGTVRVFGERDACSFLYDHMLEDFKKEDKELARIPVFHALEPCFVEFQPKPEFYKGMEAESKLIENLNELVQMEGLWGWEWYMGVKYGQPITNGWWNKELFWDDELHRIIEERIKPYSFDNQYFLFINSEEYKAEKKKKELKKQTDKLNKYYGGSLNITVI